MELDDFIARLNKAHEALASEECLTVLTSNWATKPLSEGILVNFLSAIKFLGEALEKSNKAVSLKSLVSWSPFPRGCHEWTAKIQGAPSGLVPSIGLRTGQAYWTDGIRTSIPFLGQQQSTVLDNLFTICYSC